MKKQIIEFEKDNELSKKAQDDIIEILRGEDANNINIKFAMEPKDTEDFGEEKQKEGEV